MCRKTPTRTSVRLAAEPHAAKQQISRMKGTVNPAWTRRLFPAGCGWTVVAGCAAVGGGTTDSPATPTTSHAGAATPDALFGTGRGGRMLVEGPTGLTQLATRLQPRPATTSRRGAEGPTARATVPRGSGSRR